MDVASPRHWWAVGVYNPSKSPSLLGNCYLENEVHLLVVSDREE